MEKISQFFVEKWEYLTQLFDSNQGVEGNVPSWVMNEVTFFLLVLSTLYAVYRIIKKSFISYYSWKIKRRLYKDLSYSSFSRGDVEKATKYYIPTKYQNVSPSDDEEPGSKYIASAKNELIPLFLKEAFSRYGNDNKYYLILADAGMGKTTFMINLYLAYIKKRRRFWQPPKLNIKLYSLGDPKTLDKIQSIENKHETILLLDAFDEDLDAIVDYKVRMSNILKHVDDFHDIVITSRTQFFPSEVEEPYNTGYMSFGDSNTKRNFQKLYLSVFNNKDIKHYLRKRIPFYKIRKYRRALEITRKSPSLVVRPMLLSHIEDLANSKANYNYTYEVYQILIDKWVAREASKPGIEAKYGKGRYEELLKTFSQDLAVDMYLNRKKRGGYFATIDNESLKTNELSIKDIEEDILSDTERRSRSLLNRDAEGKYKFSHKSIMEYFLAKKIVEDQEFSQNFEFKGNDAAFLFHKEMLLNEVLSPVHEYYTKRIISKCENVDSTNTLKFKQKRKSIQKSLVYYSKYKLVSNIIYDQPLRIRSGLARFEFLYKILLYNTIVRKLNETLKQSNISVSNLIYYLDNNQFDELVISLKNLEKFYFDTDLLMNIGESIDYSKVEANSKNVKTDHQTLDINEYILIMVSKFFAIMENLLYISRTDKKTKLFINNQAQLLEMLKGNKDELLKPDIEHLISISFDIFTKRFYGDVFPYSYMNPFIDRIDPIFLRTSLIMMRILKNF